MSNQPLKSRALLIIDQEPIRRSATKEMWTVFTKMQNLREKVEDFESKDRPAFTRWLRTEFNDQLTELADLQDRVGTAEDIANEVQMVRFALGCSYYDAYVNAMERRRKGVSFEESFGVGEDDEHNDEQESFEDFQKRKHGKTSGKSKGQDDADAGKGFKADAEEASANFGREDGDSAEGQSFWSKVKSSAKSATDSFKSRYRELARLLHPDLRGGGDAFSKELWERTQAAYAEKNENELEQLLVLARVSAGTADKDSSVWDLRRAVTFLKKSLRDLRSETSLMSQDMAWGFLALKDKTRLRRKISYDLEYQHDEALVRLENLEAQLARWSVPPARKTKTRQQPRSWDLEIDF